MKSNMSNKILKFASIFYKISATKRFISLFASAPMPLNMAYKIS